jgi:hypothetical protein
MKPVIHFAEAQIGSRPRIVARPRRRGLNLTSVLKQASRAGAQVAAATVASDGSVTLQFGNHEGDKPQRDNPWDVVLENDKRY